MIKFFYEYYFVSVRFVANVFSARIAKVEVGVRDLKGFEKNPTLNTNVCESAPKAFGRLSDLQDLADHPQNRGRTVTTGDATVELLDRGAEVVPARFAG